MCTNVCQWVLTLLCFSQASAHNKNLDVGANVFIGNLDPEIDEKLLYDTFSAFGVILQTPKVSKELEKHQQCWPGSCQPVHNLCGIFILF